MKEPEAYELNGHGSIVQDTKTPDLFYVTSDRDKGLYANLLQLDRVETHDGIFPLASQQDALKDQKLRVVSAQCLAEYGSVPISQVKRIFFKSDLVNQVEGVWALEWLKVLGRKMFRRGLAAA